MPCLRTPTLTASKRIPSGTATTQMAIDPEMLRRSIIQMCSAKVHAPSSDRDFFPNQVPAVMAIGDYFNAATYPWHDVQMQIMIQMSWKGQGRRGGADSPAVKAANRLVQKLRSRFIENSGYEDLDLYQLCTR